MGKFMEKGKKMKMNNKKKIAVFLIVLFMLCCIIVAFFYLYRSPKKETVITPLEGEAKILEGGKWVPLKSVGKRIKSLKNLKMKVEGGEVSVGENIKIKSDYAEVEIVGDKIIVAKGKAEIKIGNKIFQLEEGENIQADIVAGKIKSEEIKSESKTKKIVEKSSEEKSIDIGEQKKIEEKVSLPEAEKINIPNQEEKGMIAEGSEVPVKKPEMEFKIEKKQLKIFDVKINQVRELVNIKVRGENIKRIIVNDKPFYSESGKYDISIQLEEGEHDLKIFAEGMEGEIELIAQKKVLVDLTPPRFKTKIVEWVR
jgi:hypothetical protein